MRPRDDGPLPSVAGRLAWGMLALGVLVRLAHYLDRPSLWGDEAMLALNLGVRSYVGLTHPLDYAQVAPVPFLWAERLLWRLGGPSELSLRLLPLLGGCLVLFLTMRLTGRLLTPAERVVAVGLVATASFLVRYSAEVKPYATDGAVALGLVLLALWLRDDLGSAWRWVVLGVAGALAVFVSATAVLVEGGVAGALVVEGAVRRRAAIVAGALVLLAGWAGLAGATYAWWYRDVAESPYMRQFWAAGYLTTAVPDLPARLWGAIEVSLQGLSDWVVLLRITPLLLALLIAGLIVVGRRHGAAAALLLGLPFAAAFAGAAVDRYPISTRTMLYALPGVALGVAAGLSWLGSVVGRALPSLRPQIFMAAFLIPSLTVAIGAAVVRPEDEEIRPLVAELERRWHPGDAAYVLARAVPAWAFYTTHWDHPATDRLAWIAGVGGPGAPAFGNDPSRGPRRFEAVDSLRRAWRGGTELLGNSSGIEVVQWLGPSAIEPDSGWAAVEAARMRALGATVWLLYFNAPGGREAPELVAGVREASGRLSLVKAAGNARLFRVSFE